MTRVPPVAALVLLAATAWTGVAQADRVLSVIKPPLAIYDKPGDAKPSRTIQPRGLPWQVEKTEQDFLQVTIDGQRVWIDSLEVRLERKVAADGCRKSPSQAAAIAGVSGANRAVKCP